MEKCVYVVPWLRFWKIIHGDHEYFLHYSTKEEAVKLAQLISEKTHEKLIIVEKETEKMTNFDNVTTSPEALAKIISEALWFEEKLPFYKLCHECDGSVMCEECITKWLKQEAEDEENDRGREMTQTIENCTLIKKCVKNGIGEPDRFWDINRCEGYQKSENDDEPCEQCKKCKYCISREDEEVKQAVMISIHPKWCELIADGKKTIEVRKTRPKINTPFKCYIYETKGKTEYPTFIDEEGHEIYEGRGQIIGEFTCDRFYKCRYDSNGLYETYTRIFYNDGENYLSGTCLTYEDLIKYSSEDDVLYGWNIKDLVIYEKPKELNEFGLTRPPQNWFYVKETEK